MSLIKINNKNGISEITIDRPESLNAMKINKRALNLETK